MLLHPQYAPDWKPPWISGVKQWYECEDPGARRDQAMDDIRISDGKCVVIKKISTAESVPYEAEIGKLPVLQTSGVRPYNHCCVPILELVVVVRDPQNGDCPAAGHADAVTVTTVHRASLRYSRRSRKVLPAGKHWRHNIAHRDAMMLNMMVDPVPIFPDMSHFFFPTYDRDQARPAKCYTRTERPTRYFETDFGWSRRYDQEAVPPCGGPFSTDVYCRRPKREYFLQMAWFMSILRGERRLGWKRSWNASRPFARSSTGGNSAPG
ncbi:uncharacterized protein C8Q71DRAFT_10486 [Rhodofomes roseus]|uniref:Protein kinase domain-containing protein n=1 Tax=Rhodofomes roseus TaxID=34475 RepID=A0ABQ8KYM2_9APHY|nr:uncharacterized protein C8Q71DRAFT_10486 [Rhodofomes roseus]KAH9843695.1 hypothetical protein C8Q71DRAFT_10486 [Rhodofomes roseus]